MPEFVKPAGRTTLTPAQKRRAVAEAKSALGKRGLGPVKPWGEGSKFNFLPVRKPPKTPGRRGGDFGWGG